MIPYHAQKMAKLMRTFGIDAGDVVCVTGENHDTVKPPLVSRGLRFIEAALIEGHSENRCVAYNEARRGRTKIEETEIHKVLVFALCATAFTSLVLALSRK